LGASLYQIACGTPAFAAANAAELVRAICHGRPRPVGDRCNWLAAPLAAVIMRLLSRDPAERHSSAAVLLDDLARVREALELPAPDAEAEYDPALLPPRVVGREPVLAALRELFAAVAAGRPSERLAYLVGPAGVGKLSAVDHAVRQHQLAVASGAAGELRFVRQDLHAIAPATATPETPAAGPRALQRHVDEVLAELAERAGFSPTIVLLSDGGDDERIPVLVRALHGHDEVARRPLGFVVVRDGEPSRAGTDGAELIVPPLTEAQVGQLAESMLGRSLPPAWVASLARASDGLPQVAADIIRAVAADNGVDHVTDCDLNALVGAAGADAVGPLYVRRVAQLDPADAALIEAVAVAGGAAELDEVAASVAAPAAECAERLAALAAAGLVNLAGSRVALPGRHHRDAVHDALAPARKKALHRAALAYLEAAGVRDPLRLARHRLVTGPAAASAEACGDAARLLASRGQLGQALPYARRAAALARGTAAADAHIELAELATAVGAYDEAIEAATAAARSRSKQRRRRARIVLARALQKRGDSDRAAELMVELLEQDDGDADLVGSYCRLLVSRGDYAAALEVAGEVARGDGAPTAGEALRLESAGLAHLYQGDTDAAAHIFARFEARARTGRDRALYGRALGLRGMVAQMGGRIADAARLYERAEIEARSASDIHAAAVYAINRATAQTAQGRHGDALAALTRAERNLRRLGEVTELAAVKFNRGLALLAVGELNAARRAAAEALGLAQADGAAQMQIYARLLEGDIYVRNNELEPAIDSYRTAVDSARAGGGRDLLMAQLNLARALATRGDAAAMDILAEAGAVDHRDDDQDRIALARGRVALALDRADRSAELDTERKRLRDAGTVDLAWRADLVSARLALAAGDRERAAELCRLARHTADAIMAANSESHRPGLQTDPDRVALRELERALELAVDPAAATSTPVASDEPHLRRLLSLSRRLNSELRLAPLLDEVIDAVIELTRAERGFLLLDQPGGDLEVLVARNFDHSALAGDEVRMSRSIAEKAARTGEVVLTVDAAFDDRFGAAASVAALRLRSVLAVPLRQKGRVTGTIYIDHRFRRGAFDADAVEMVRQLADIAAIAIENARLVEENQRRQQAISELNRRLEREMTAVEAELATVKAQLAEDPNHGLRHAYDTIVGRSAPMLELLRHLDRATDTALPVVICGESGTGKELVARALHQNGARADKPFVAVNCGAVAEELLESELFGHVRGAFTSADRDRHGLFEVADGGTLFLDEVADTSLAMQAKLLRVLQEGEIRRVGDHQLRKVDVRIIAATNRALPDLVAAGSFREDLFYRLNVLNLELPPLRKRVEDVPALAEHILARLSGDDTPPEVTKAALARLTTYDWPGNVRELQNELSRATALCDGSIDVEDLSPHIAALRPRPRPPAGADLDLKPQVESLERSLVEEALRRTDNNQTAAAKLLGLSRYGLQKKIKRYGIEYP